MYKRILIALFIVVLTLPLSSLVVAAGPSFDQVSDELVVTRNDSIMEAKPTKPSAAKTPPSIIITSPADHSEVSGSIDIIAEVTDDQGIKKVEYSIDGADWVVMSVVGGDTYKASWDSLSVADGNHLITVRATDSRNTKGQDSVSVNTDNGITPPPPPPVKTYALDIEIDYIEGHMPTQAVLDYIVGYYDGGNPSGDLIDVNFTLGDEIPEDVSMSDGISISEFWALEAAYNDGGDNAGGNPNAGLYNSKDKWVLYGTTVEGSPGTVGYCYVVSAGFPKADALYGNYIYIADETADSIEDYGAEAVVLMHELGHSIGIEVIRAGSEVYDPDAGSVMSYVSSANVLLYDEWYYSVKYWDTRNLEYYEVVS